MLIASLAASHVATAQVARFGDPEQLTPFRPEDPDPEQPRCIVDPANCLAFPAFLRVDRRAVVDALQIDAACGEDGDFDVTAERLGMLDRSGTPAEIAQAIRHVVQSEPSLNLQSVKLAIEMLTRLDDPTMLESLEEIFDQSNILSERAFGRREIPGLVIPEKRKMLSNQAEELRRLVVLALAGRSDGKELMLKAFDDRGRSVSYAAAREMLSRSDQSLVEMVYRRCDEWVGRVKPAYCALLEGGSSNVVKR